MAERRRGAALLATSDLHVRFPENRAIVERMRPRSSDDWLLVAGDVGELVDDIAWALKLLSGRFHTVVWVPGNHELWTHPADPVLRRGEARYQLLVELCRQLGVVTPEDPYLLWEGEGGPAVVVPLFVGYDYSFRLPGTATKQDALRQAEAAGIVSADEYLLHPDPYETREAWCEQRVAVTERRLQTLDPATPTILVNHFPLVREPTAVLRRPEVALWSGTVRTADWCRRFRASVAVYGHLHIPRATVWDGVRHEEVSIGYPREWRRRGHPLGVLRQILPSPIPQEPPSPWPAGGPER